jgi:hypothetical protein
LAVVVAVHFVVALTPACDDAAGDEGHEHTYVESGAAAGRGERDKVWQVAGHRPSAVVAEVE